MSGKVLTLLLLLTLRSGKPSAKDDFPHRNGAASSTSNDVKDVRFQTYGLQGPYVLISFGVHHIEEIEVEMGDLNFLIELEGSEGGCLFRTLELHEFRRRLIDGFLELPADLSEFAERASLHGLSRFDVLDELVGGTDYVLEPISVCDVSGLVSTTSTADLVQHHVTNVYYVDDRDDGDKKLIVFEFATEEDFLRAELSAFRFYCIAATFIIDYKGKLFAGIPTVYSRAARLAQGFFDCGFLVVGDNGPSSLLEQSDFVERHEGDVNIISEILIKGAGGVDGAAGVDGVAHDVSPVPLGLKSPEGRCGFDFERACDRSAALPRPEGRVTLRADRSFAVFVTVFGELEARHRHPPVGVGDGFECRLTLTEDGHCGNDILAEGLVEAVELVAQLRQVAHLLRGALCYNVAFELCKHFVYLLVLILDASVRPPRRVRILASTKKIKKYNGCWSLEFTFVGTKSFCLEG